MSTVVEGTGSEVVYIINTDSNDGGRNTFESGDKDISVKANELCDVSNILENEPSSNDEFYNPFQSKECSVVSSVTFSEKCLNNRLGPFSDNRIICECDTIKRLMTNRDARYLLCLLHDIAEMNTKQKLAFKNRIFQLINRVLTGDSIDVNI